RRRRHRAHPRGPRRRRLRQHVHAERRDHGAGAADDAGGVLRAGEGRQGDVAGGADVTALEAEDVVWDLSDLLAGRDDEGAVTELLDRADELGEALAEGRGTAGSWDAGRLAQFMGDQAEL